jgi:hypothetical protein
MRPYHVFVSDGATTNEYAVYYMSDELTDLLLAIGHDDPPWFSFRSHYIADSIAQYVDRNQLRYRRRRGKRKTVWSAVTTTGFPLLYALVNAPTFAMRDLRAHVLQHLTSLKPKLDYAKMRATMRPLKEELLKTCMHPRNATRLASWGL